MRQTQAYAMIEHGGLMAGMRGNFPPEVALRVSEVLMQAGINIFEFTMNSVQPLEAMQAVKREYGNSACVGMGTVLDSVMAAQALDAGAEIIIAPSFDPRVVELAHSQDVLAVPGVLTPTECVNAWSMGTKILKIFPIGNMGLDYFKSIRGPLDHIKFMCNGSMSDENVGAFIKAGAVACGMAGWLTGDGSLPLETIANRARSLRAIVDQVKSAYPQAAKA